MAEIIPAILPKNYEDLKNKIALFRGVAPLVQIDICDGIFVPNLSWPFLKKSNYNNSEKSDFEENELDIHFRNILNEGEGMPFWEDIDFELDLMVSDAMENFDIYSKLGAKRMVFHLESLLSVEEFKHFIEGMDMYIRESLEIGIAIDVDVSLEKVFPLLNDVDFVQCMGIDKVGFQGQEFDKKVIENIKNLKEKFKDLVISVDGGINLETASSLINAGADRLIVGSAILNSQDIIGTIEEFKNLG